jgi:SpoU rRNA methylase family enzyme
MFNIDSALELMNKYGYSSITSHPYIYQAGESLGVCYTYVDEDYGKLERIKICKSLEELEEFLEAYRWLEKNGKQRHVRMILDNYESYNPKVMFLRNEKIMVEGEMFDIDSYDQKEAARQGMDQTSKLIYESGDLLLVYNEIKNRQQLYLKSLVALKNNLRGKYFDLQKEVDTYNKNKVKRELTLLPDAVESGINETLEIALKDRYNKYIVQMPDIMEAQDFLKEVWDMNYNLEMNSKYYDAMREDSAIRNEMKVVEQKIAFMKDLNDDIKPLFGTDLVANFQNINKKAEANSANVSEDTVNTAMDAVKRKYSYYSRLDPLYTSDFLREAIQNTNYEDLAIKYAVGASPNILGKNKTPLNEIAADLTVKYKEKLNLEEQSILVLYNNEKYRKICDVILSIPNFETLTSKDIVKALSSIKNLSKLKSECYESVKKRIDAPENASIKASLFNNVDFTSFETFIGSLVRKLSLLRNVNERMVLSGDINMYLTIEDVNELNLKSFMTVTNDLVTLVDDANKNKRMIGITLLKENTPILYSPYYFDLGDTFSKNASPLMYIKEMVNFDLLVDVSDIIVNIDPNKTNVVMYDSVSEIDGNLTLVKDLHAKCNILFCKYALTSKNVNSQTVAAVMTEQIEVLEEPTNNVVS